MLFDIEADGLLPEVKKIYCMSYTLDYKTIQTETSVGKIVQILKAQKMLIGHSIIGYDLPALTKVLGVNFDHLDLKLDTLFLSYYLRPDRRKHGLEDYGEDFGYPKVKVDDEQWKEGNLDLMVERCERDVEINLILWKQQIKTLRELYG